MKGQRLIRFRRITAFICAVLILFGAMPMQSFEGVFKTDRVAVAQAVSVEYSGILDFNFDGTVKNGDTTISLNGGVVIKEGTKLVSNAGTEDDQNTVVYAFVKGKKLCELSSGNEWTTDRDYTVKKVYTWSKDISYDVTKRFYTLYLSIGEATVETAPTPKYLTYTGSEQELVGAPVVENGEMYYSLYSDAAEFLPPDAIILLILKPVI